MLFNFGGNTGLTHSEIQRQREIAASLRAANMQTPQTVGQGLSAIGRALGARRRERRADEAEAQNRQAFTEQLSSTFAPQQTYANTADAEAIKTGLIQRGLPEHVAQGFVMNMMDESGLDPTINEISPLVPGSRGGFGLYQLTGPRRVAFENYAAQRGLDLGSVDAQLDFLMTELQGPEADAFRSIMATTDPNSAAVAIARDFLRPSQENLDRRIAQYQGDGQSTASTQQILELLSSPYATDAQRMYLGEMLQRSMPLSREQQLREALLEAQIGAELTPKDTRTADQKNYDAYSQQEAAAGRQPLSFNDWRLQEAEIEAGQAANAEVVSFTLDQAGALSEAGLQAGRNAGRLQVLSSLLEDAPQGFTGAITQMAGNFGIDVEGLDKVQAATAIINAMVPEQRPAGSGPMSDADLELFKQSLPRIINTPAGNELIMRVLKANVDWDMRVGRIADDLLTGDINSKSISAFRQELRSIDSPLENLADEINAAVDAAEVSEMPIVASDADYDALPIGARFKDESGNIYVKERE